MKSRTNVVVLRGTIANEPNIRQLQSGATVLQFDLRTIVDGEAAGTASVPVSWTEPPTNGIDIVAVGTEIVVAGTVRRRFFRSGGQTQSRTEVVVERVVPTRRKKSVRSLIVSIADDLTQGFG